MNAPALAAVEMTRVRKRTPWRRRWLECSQVVGERPGVAPRRGDEELDLGVKVAVDDGLDGVDKLVGGGPVELADEEHDGVVAGVGERDVSHGCVPAPAHRERTPETREGGGRKRALAPCVAACRCQEQRGEEGHEPESQGNKERGRHDAWTRPRLAEQARDEYPGADESTREAGGGNRQANGNRPAPQAGRDTSMQLGNQRANTRRQVGRDRGTQNP